MEARRLLDFVIMGYFFINLVFITPIVDFEQLAIKDPDNFEYPIWPPKWGVDLVHWYARNFDPVIIARPVWWKVTIWWDTLFFGPFYAFALYAFWNKKNWIRFPAIIYSCVLFTILTFILSEETWGPHATPAFELVMLLNAPWVLFPLIILYIMVKDEPFPKSQTSASKKNK